MNRRQQHVLCCLLPALLMLSGAAGTEETDKASTQNGAAMNLEVDVGDPRNAEFSKGVERISLESALSRALANNIELALRRADEAVARARAKTGRSALLPALEADAGFSLVDGTVQGSFGDFRSIDSHGHRVGVGVLYRLNIGEQIKEIAALRQEMDAAVSQSLAQEQRLILRVVELYENLVLAKNGVGIARALVDDSESFLHIAKARSKGGVGLQSDVERAKANLASSLSRLEEVREVWRQTSTQLATVLQADPEILLDPSDGGVAQWDLPNLSSSSELTELALSRPDIEAMRAQASASVERVKAARWDLFAPELIAEARFSGVGGRGETAEPERADVLSNAIGSVGRAANNWRNVLGGGAPISSAAGSFGRAFYDYRDVFRDNESEVGLESRFNLSVGLTWTFSFGKHSQIQERKAELERAELRVRQLENRAAGEVQAAKSAIASAAERIEQAGDELVAAEANNRIAMARFREGTAIALEVLDAQRVVAQSRLSLIRHITENNLAQTRLLAAAGILEAEAIRELRHQQ